MDQIDTDVQQVGDCENCGRVTDDLHMFHDLGPFCNLCWAEAAEEYNQQERDAFYDRYYGPNRGGY